MRTYSHFFSTLHDEEGPVGELGRGTHYSVLRAIIWGMDGPKFHDIAVIWDEDHDPRAIWILERLYSENLLSKIKAIGERKGSITVLVSEDVGQDFRDRVSGISESIPFDCFSSSVEDFSVDSGGIINDRDDRVRGYLDGIDALWILGSKPCKLSVSETDGTYCFK